MRIVKLEAENVKRLSAVSIAPTGNIVEITGKNSQGKTSVLDSIWWALAGTRGAQAEPIRRGEPEAIISLDLGALKVTRKFKRKGEDYTTSLVVENADGAQYKKPQDMLDALVGELSFDPLAFARMKPREQFDALRKFVPGVDFDAIDAQNAADKATRKVANDRASDAEAGADSILTSSEPPDEIEEQALHEAVNDASNNNVKRQEWIATRDKLLSRIAVGASHIEDDRHTIEGINKTIQEFQERRDRMQKGIATTQALIASLEGEVTKMGPEPAEVAVAKALDALNDAKRQNEKARQWYEANKRRDDLIKKAREYKVKSDELTAAINQREQVKRASIAAAKMPVDGIGFGDSLITLNGLPFDQASDAEQLRASVAIAAAGNQKLRVIRVRDGSLLDADSMALLATLAETHDLQIWLESVQSGRATAIVIEDGHVKRQDETAQEKVSVRT